MQAATEKKSKPQTRPRPASGGTGRKNGPPSSTGGSNLVTTGGSGDRNSGNGGSDGPGIPHIPGKNEQGPEFKRPVLLGEILLELDFCTGDQIEKALAIQRQRRNSGSDDETPAKIPVKQFRGRQLGQILFETGVISDDQLEEALAVQRGQSGLLGRILVNLGYTTHSEISRAAAAQQGKEFFELDPSFVPEKKALRILPATTAVAYRVFPVDYDPENRLLTLAVPDGQTQAVKFMERELSISIKPVYASSDAISDKLQTAVSGNEWKDLSSQTEM